ncbi:hypothetical protein BKA18_006810 [Streptomyces auratus]
MTGRVVECSIDEMGRPRVSKGAALRIPPNGPCDVGVTGDILTLK